ncbi:MAG: hypothetical protein AABY22_04150 [Nanoarchaeota archaeon]
MNRNKKRSKKIDVKKEREIVEALKKLNNSGKKEEKSKLEKELSKTNINNDFFVEASSGGHVAPVLRRGQRAESLDSNFPNIAGQNVDRRTETGAITYTADRKGYIGEEYKANARRDQERVVNAQTARKIQAQRAVNPRDLLAGDPRVQEIERPRLMDRREDERSIRIEEDYKGYESKLPFQKDEKKYKGRV